MTRDEFLDVMGEAPGGAPVIWMLDGRMGPCPHCDSTEVLVDIYRDGQTDTVRVPFARIARKSVGVLAEQPA